MASRNKNDDLFPSAEDYETGAKPPASPYNLMEEEEEDGTGANDDDNQSEAYFDAADDAPLPSSHNPSLPNEQGRLRNDDSSVPLLEEDDSRSWVTRRLHQLVTTHALPTSTEWYRICGIALVENTVALLYLKFLVTTLCSIVVLHLAVRLYAAISGYTDYDAEYSLVDFVKFDLNLVILDTLAFFAAGRLYRLEGGCDVIWPFLAPLLVGMLFEILIAPLSFLQHSVSLYEIHCTWPWQLWTYVAVIFVGSIALGLHFVHHVITKESSWGYRLTEAIAIVSIFLVPFVTDANFHFHHWYFALLMGPLLHSAAPSSSPQALWYAVPLQAYFWGLYINGIAVYGRDPILTCEYAYFVGSDLQCNYSTVQPKATMGEETQDDVVRSTVHLMHGFMSSLYRQYTSSNNSPDWQHCTGGGP